MTTDSGAAAQTENETKTPKSIVPSKFNDGRYKNGGSDPVAEFIKAKAYDKGQVVLSSLYALARANGIAEEQVAKYEAQTEVEKPAQGAAGRARMTIGNMIRAKARKNGKLVDLSGNEELFEGLAKPALSGAAASAKENAGEIADATGEETGTVETVEDEEEVTDETE